MWLKKILGDGLDFAENFLMLVENILKFVEVHLELLLLQKDDSGSLRDLNVLSLKTFGFTDELENSNIEVDIQGSGVRFSDNQSGLETSFGSLNLFAPGSEEPLLVDLEFKTDGIIGGQLCLKLVFGDGCLWELVNWTGDLLEKMSSPDDFSSLWWHVSDRWWVLFGMLIELLLDGFQISSIYMKNMVIFVL